MNTAWYGLVWYGMLWYGLVSAAEVAHPQLDQQAAASVVLPRIASGGSYYAANLVQKYKQNQM